MVVEHRSALLAALLLAFTACEHLASNEAKVVGKWSRAGMDFTAIHVFQSDHTTASFFKIEGEWVKATYGTWRLEGNQLITEEESVSSPGYPAKPKQVVSETILEFQPDKLVREKGRPPYLRVK